MSDAEAKFHKLKVTELKELLAKHHLVQSGKKDELVKRLMDNNISPEGEEELVEPPADDVAPPKPVSAAKPPSSAKPPSKSAPAPAPAASSSADAGAAPAEPKELTEDQKAMKARAERFGIPFNPNPVPTNRGAKATPPSSTPGAGKPDSSSKPAAAAAAPAKEAAKEPKKGIDSAPLGISQEVLAARAAKFGIPEKKETPPAAAPVAVAAKTDKPASKPASKSASKPASEAKKPTAEVTPEMAARIAEEEEKKRKRAEKFGTGAATNGSSEPDAKKVKV